MRPIKNRKSRVVKNKVKDSAKARKLRSYKQKMFNTLKIISFIIFLFVFWLIYVNFNKITNEIYNISGRLGFSLENITVHGQKYSNNEQIAAELKLKKGMPIFEVSLYSIKDRLEKIQWIKHAIVERELPDTIRIYILEREPIALGQKDRKLYLIDEEGFIIKEKNLSGFAHLPIIIGEGAEIYANSLLTILKKDPDLFKKISSVSYISERRWNVIFDNELEVKLPEDNVDKAWDKVIKLYKNNELFLPDIAVIDLRLSNKIYVEKKN